MRWPFVVSNLTEPFCRRIDYRVDMPDEGEAICELKGCTLTSDYVVGGRGGGHEFVGMLVCHDCAVKFCRLTGESFRR